MKKEKKDERHLPDEDSYDVSFMIYATLAFAFIGIFTSLAVAVFLKLMLDIDQWQFIAVYGITLATLVYVASTALFRGSNWEKEHETDLAGLGFNGFDDDDGGGLNDDDLETLRKYIPP